VQNSNIQKFGKTTLSDNKFSKHRLVTQTSIVTVLAGITALFETYLSFSHGILSRPMIYDGIAYCKKGKMLASTFQDEGFLALITKSYSLREPLWDFFLSLGFILFNSYEDWAAYTSRFFPILILLLAVNKICVSRKFKFSIFLFAVIITAFLPIIFPSIRAVFPSKIYPNMYVLADLRPDFLWATILVYLVVYVVEQRKRTDGIFFVSIGLITGLGCMAKGMTSLLMISTAGILLIYYIITNREQSIMLFGKAIFLSLISFISIIVPWKIQGGFDSNAARFVNARNSTQVLWDNLSFAERFSKYVKVTEWHLGFYECAVILLVLLLSAILTLRKRKIQPHSLIYAVIMTHILVILSTANSNLLVTLPVSLLFFLIGIIHLSSIGEHFIKNSYFIYLSIIVFILFWFYSSIYANYEMRTELNNIYFEKGYLKNEKDSYLDMLVDVESLMAPDDSILNNYQIYGGIMGMNYYTGKEHKFTWMNISQSVEKFMNSINDTEFLLLDDSSSLAIYGGKRKVFFGELYDHLDGNNRFEKIRTYRVNKFSLRYSLSNEMNVNQRSISLYRNNAN